MNTDDLVTDMAQDVLEKRAPDLPAETKRLSCGIVARRLDLTSETQAKRLGRERGIYLTFDCTEGTFASGGGAGVLSRHIARAVVDMAGVMGRRSVVLAAGLGNAGVTADSLGAATTELLDVSPVSEAERKRQKVRLCAVNAGVEGRTGIRSADVVAGVWRGYVPPASSSSTHLPRLLRSDSARPFSLPRRASLPAAEWDATVPA